MMHLQAHCTQAMTCWAVAIEPQPTRLLGGAGMQGALNRQDVLKLLGTEGALAFTLAQGCPVEAVPAEEVQGGQLQGQPCGCAPAVLEHARL